LILGLVLLAGLGGGAVWLWWFLQHQLSPQLTQTLSQIVGRPVTVGDLESIALDTIRFGPSGLPATATDPDQVKVQGIEVRFNLWTFLRTQTLPMDIVLDTPEVYVEQGTDGQWLDLELQLGLEPSPVTLDWGTITVQQGAIALVPRLPDQTLGPVVELVTLQTQVEVLEAQQTLVLRGSGLIPAVDAFQLAPLLGGEASMLPVGKLAFTGEANLTTPTLAITTQWQDLQLANLAAFTALSPVALEEGQISGSLELVLDPEGLQSWEGKASLKDITVAVPGLPQPLTDGELQLQFQDQQVEITQATAQLGAIAPKVKGQIDLGQEQHLDLVVQVPILNLGELLETWDVALPVAVQGAADLRVDVNGPLTAPLITSTLIAGAPNPLQVDRVALDQLAIALDLIPDADPATPPTVSLEIKGGSDVWGSIVGQGQIQLQEDPALDLTFQLQEISLEAIAQAYGGQLPPGTSSATAQVSGSVQAPTITAQWSLPQDSYLDQTMPPAHSQDAHFALGTGSLALAGKLQDGEWSLELVAGQIPLEFIRSDLQGLVSGTFTAAGPLANLQPSTTMLRGAFELPTGLAQWPYPISGAVQWDGTNLQPQVTSQGVQVGGAIAAQFNGLAMPEITGLDLTLQAQDFDLQTLPDSWGLPLKIAGQLDAVGQIQGTAPRFQGDLVLNNLVVTGFDFAPQLQGTLMVGQKDGLDLSLQGDQDIIAVKIPPDQETISLLIQRETARLAAQSQGDSLQFEAEKVPLEDLDLASYIDPEMGIVSGDVSGQGSFNWRTGEVVATASIDRPMLGPLNSKRLALTDMRLNWKQGRAQGSLQVEQPRTSQISGDRLQANLRYGNGTAFIEDGEIDVGQSRIRFNAQGHLEPEPRMQGTAQIDQGHLEDVISAFKWSRLGDPAGALELNAVGLPDSSLMTQLQRFSEIKALVAQEKKAQQQGQIVPPVTSLQGTFEGMINFAGSPQGLNLGFELQGEDWEWGQSLKAERAIIEGTLENNTLTLLPFRLEQDEAFLSFVGKIGDTQQLGQLQLRNIPVDGWLQETIDLPLEVAGGSLDLSATISGDLADLQSLGTLRLRDGLLNNTPITDAQGSFNYNQSRLNFASTLQVGEVDPIQIQGGIPYQLPFAANPPVSDQLRLQIEARDGALGLLNILTDQVAWVDGQGSVILEAQGTVDQPLIQGTAALQGAAFQTSTLPVPLTDVTGEVVFNGDRLTIPSLTGQFSGGQVAIQGTLPLLARPKNGPPPTEPRLQVNLDGLDLDLEGMYRGGVDGQLWVTGNAFTPQVSGAITLSQGRLFLPNNPAAIPAEVSRELRQFSATPSLVARSELNNLQVRLGDRLQIVDQPVLNFRVRGDIVMNGTLAAIEPTGTLVLEQGQVDLFTNQFTLNPSYDNRAIFRPDRGLDPELDVRLVTSAFEVNQNGQAATAFSSEINDPLTNTIGRSQAVRIEAVAQGPASDLTSHLTLRSSPPRTESEILGLLGGNLVNTLGQGNGVVVLASTLLSRTQVRVGEALGLSDLRFFPATLLDEDQEEGTASTRLGLGIEVGVNLTQDLSISLQEILAADQNTRFSFGYRVTDRVRLRASTGVAEDSRVSVGYETRF